MTHLYLIYNKRTKEWLSILDDKGRIRRRGHTYAKLSKVEPPRLFTSQRGAIYALRAWLSGEITVHTFFDVNGDDYQDWRTKPVPSRKADDMAIRKCKVVLQ